MKQRNSPKGTSPLSPLNISTTRNDVLTWVTDSERAHRLYLYSIYNDDLCSIPGSSAAADTKNSVLLLNLNFTAS